ncbi:MAG: hypothetical protein KC423_25205, partial [Anaerolineales bacterium]|nr:hypothetical protein [Anaerolineales bacterium]
MTIAEREQQILRIKKASFQSELDEQLETHMRQQVVLAVQTTLEAALVQEVEADVATLTSPPRRSGYFHRILASMVVLSHWPSPSCGMVT